MLDIINKIYNGTGSGNIISGAKLFEIKKIYAVKNFINLFCINSPSFFANQ